VHRAAPKPAPKPAAAKPETKKPEPNKKAEADTKKPAAR
jgi:hypothetical protein